MALRQLGSRSFDEIDDGRMGAEIRRHLAMMALDCEARPHIATARKVTLEVTLTPVPDGTGLDHVDCQVKCKSIAPHNRSTTFQAKVKHNGELIFNVDSLDNVDQTTVFDNDDN